MENKENQDISNNSEIIQEDKQGAGLGVNLPKTNNNIREITSNLLYFVFYFITFFYLLFVFYMLVGYLRKHAKPQTSNFFRSKFLTLLVPLCILTIVIDFGLGNNIIPVFGFLPYLLYLMCVSPTPKKNKLPLFFSREELSEINTFKKNVEDGTIKLKDNVLDNPHQVNIGETVGKIIRENKDANLVTHIEGNILRKVPWGPFGNIFKKKKATDDKPRMNILYSFLDNFSLPGTSLIGYFFDDVTWQAIQNITKMDPNEIECFNDEINEKKEDGGEIPYVETRMADILTGWKEDKDPSSSTDDADGDAADGDADGAAKSAAEGAERDANRAYRTGDIHTASTASTGSDIESEDDKKPAGPKDKGISGGNPPQYFSTVQQYPYGQQQHQQQHQQQYQQQQHQQHGQQYQQQQHQQQQYQQQQQQYPGHQYPLYQSSYVKPYQRYDIQHS